MLSQLRKFNENFWKVDKTFEASLFTHSIRPPKTPLTAKDPLVHIFKYSDFSSELEKGIATVKRRNKKPNK